MLRSVAEVSLLTGFSKVSIYNKLKLKEMEQYIVKNKGITYVTEDGVVLIKQGLNLKEDTLNPLNNSLKEDIEELATTMDNTYIEEFKVEFKELNKDYLNSLKKENELLRMQLQEKDKQIAELHKLIENSQVLLKEEQQKHLHLLDKLEDPKDNINKKGFFRWLKYSK